MRRASLRRRAASAVELLICSAIMVAAFVPIYTLVQSNQKMAYLGEYHVLARRRAYRALACLEGLPYTSLQEASKGRESPPAGIPLLPTEGNRIGFELGDGEMDVEIAQLKDHQGDLYVQRVKGMKTDVFFTQLEPGLGRLAALVRWNDPTSGHEKSFVTVRFVQAPFHFWVSR